MTKSPVREMVDPKHQVFASLAEAQKGGGVVVFEGDWGGQIYAVVPASRVRCSEKALGALLAEMDRTCWDEPDGARVLYEKRAVGDAIAGGMGGAVVRAGLWLHADVEPMRERIERVLDDSDR